MVVKDNDDEGVLFHDVDVTEHGGVEAERVGSFRADLSHFC
jgi:hypothetical protein